MKVLNLLPTAMAAALLAVSQAALAGPGPDAAKQPGFDGSTVLQSATTLKAASARSIASRATATSSATVYGGFELASSAVVYILVRGNSMGTLGVTQNYLDAPRFRLYGASGQDLVFDVAGRPGFNFCQSSDADDLLVINYYQNVRAAPVHSRDACLAATFTAGVYTFSVTPSTVANAGAASVPGSGEILFEVTLGP